MFHQTTHRKGIIISDNPIWSTAEWAEPSEDIEAAYLNGIEGVIQRNFDDDKWFWIVKPTSSRSEYPEVYTTGYAEFKGLARIRAIKAMKQADAEYQHINYG